MKKNVICSTVLLLTSLCVSIPVLAATEGVTGTIQSVRTYGDGRVLVTGFTFSTATCSNGSFWIPGDHPQLARLLATVLSAKASGASITVVAKTDCAWFPEITPDSSTLIIIN